MNEDPTEAKYRRAATFYDQDAEEATREEVYRHAMDEAFADFDQPAVDPVTELQDEVSELRAALFDTDEELRNARQEVVTQTSAARDYRGMWADELNREVSGRDPIRAGLLSLVACILLFLTFAFGVWWGHNHPERPYCPAEDSCTADYQNGEWTITEDQP